MSFFPDLDSRGAVFSPDRRYRYLLWRVWDQSRLALPWLMYNPSNGSEFVDDPTIKRVISFSEREGFGGCSIVNLHALVTSDPSRLTAALDCIGPANETHLKQRIARAAEQKTPIVCAWGAGSIIDKNRDLDFIQAARAANVELWCLGKNKAGSPKHPLYIGLGTPFESFP